MTGIDVTIPQAGFYRHRLARCSVMVGVRLEYGPPLDPVTGEILDRSWRWMAYLDDGSLATFDDIWPKCASTPITEVEYRRYCARQDWAREHAPDSAYAGVGKKLDPLDTRNPMPF